MWDVEQRVPYLHRNEFWIGYDDEQSVREKASILCTTKPYMHVLSLFLYGTSNE